MKVLQLIDPALRGELLNSHRVDVVLFVEVLHVGEECLRYAYLGLLERPRVVVDLLEYAPEGGAVCKELLE